MPVKLTLQEKIELVLIVGDNYKTYREAAVLFNESHPENHISHMTVKNVVDKFKTTGSVENKFKKNHDRRVNNAENQLLIMQAVVENPKTSLTRISQVLPNNIGKSTISKVLRSNKFHPYKPKFLHKLIPRDLISRFNFCVWFQGIIEDDPFLLEKFFSPMKQRSHLMELCVLKILVGGALKILTSTLNVGTSIRLKPTCGLEF